MGHLHNHRFLPLAQEAGRLSELARSWAHLPWITLAAALAAWILEMQPQVQSLLQYDRSAIIAGEGWRIFTGHLTHWNGDHFLWDAVVFLALGAFCERWNKKYFLAFLALGSLLISLAVWAGQSQMIYYRGLSGIDAGLYLMALLIFLQNTRTEGSLARRVLAVLLFLAFVAKVGYEVIAGETVFVKNSMEFVPVPLAHLAGALAGILTVFFASVGKGNQAH